MSNKVFWLLALAVVGIAAFIGVPHLRSRFMGPSFPEDALRTWEELATTEHEPLVEPEGQLYRTGKVVVAEFSKRKVLGVGAYVMSGGDVLDANTRGKSREVEPPRAHAVMDEIDQSIRANDPDEVATVIFCDQKDVKIPRLMIFWSNGGTTTKPGYTGPVTYLRLYDVKSGRYIGLASMKSGSDAVVSFVDSLPLR